jgi:DnaK suppressor protein
MNIAPDSWLALAGALRQRRTELLARLGAELAASDEQHLTDLAGKVHDAGDESVADLLADLDAARMDRQVDELRHIEQALARMVEGSYGVCGDCGENIALARLEAQPAANRCITCQDRHEHAAGAAAAPRL